FGTGELPPRVRGEARPEPGLLLRVELDHLARVRVAQRLGDERDWIGPPPGEGLGIDGNGRRLGARGRPRPTSLLKLGRDEGAASAGHYDVPAPLIGGRRATVADAGPGVSFSAPPSMMIRGRDAASASAATTSSWTSFAWRSRPSRQRVASRAL